MGPGDDETGVARHKGTERARCLNSSWYLYWYSHDIQSRLCEDGHIGFAVTNVSIVFDLHKGGIARRPPLFFPPLPPRSKSRPSDRPSGRPSDRPSDR